MEGARDPEELAGELPDDSFSRVGFATSSRNI